MSVASQIGHLFVYDLLDKKLIFNEKVHLGGIEGLAMKGRVVYTAGSDNMTILSKLDFELPHIAPKEQQALPETQKL